MYLNKILDDPGPSQEMEALGCILEPDIIANKVILDNSDTAVIWYESTINVMAAYPCQIIALNERLFKQYYALGLQEDSEITPIIDYWLLKLEQSGELNFWKSKVRQTLLHLFINKCNHLQMEHSINNFKNVAVLFLVQKA